MEILCHATEDIEVLFLRSLLQDAEIPFFIVGEHFGSLYPGVQVASFNERRFLVPEEKLEQAKSLVSEHRNHYEPAFTDLDTKSKFRICTETLVFGWAFPYGKKRNNS